MRWPLVEALAWIGAAVAALGTERIETSAAVGRMLASPCDGAVWPGADRVAVDGYGGQAGLSEGASDDNPLPAVDAMLLAAGAAIPPGLDAVAPYSAVHRDGAVLEVLAPVARGAGIERRGGDAGLGFQVPAGLLRPDAVALLQLLGVEWVEVVRQPNVAIVVAAAKTGPDVLTPLLARLVEDDGGAAGFFVSPAAVPPGADLVLLAGRSGCGWDDDMPHQLAAAGGALDQHGVAVRPGDSAGLGWLNGAPVVLLPGAPASALTIYDLLAGPAVQTLAGRAAVPRGLQQGAVLERKITSAVGFADVVRVKLDGGRATPLGPADAGGLARVVLSDGWVVVPEGQEGFPAGSGVVVNRRLGAA